MTGLVFFRLGVNDGGTGAPGMLVLLSLRGRDGIVGLDAGTALTAAVERGDMSGLLLSVLPDTENADGVTVSGADCMSSDFPSAVKAAVDVDMEEADEKPGVSTDAPDTSELPAALTSAVHEKRLLDASKREVSKREKSNGLCEVSVTRGDNTRAGSFVVTDSLGVTGSLGVDEHESLGVNIGSRGVVTCSRGVCSWSRGVSDESWFSLSPEFCSKGDRSVVGLRGLALFPKGSVEVDSKKLRKLDTVLGFGSSSVDTSSLKLAA